MTRERLTSVLVLAVIGGLLVLGLWWIPHLGTMLLVLTVIYGLLMGLGCLLGALRED